MKVFLGLGSNLGNREQNLEAAIGRISQRCKIIKRSLVYETDAKYVKNQPKFLNMVIEIGTDMDPYELLGFLQLEENHLGRKREEETRNGPRVIDLDILYYKGLEVRTEKLTIPHPRMLERAFVMIPFAEIAPDLKILGLTIAELAEKVPKEEKKGIKIFKGTRPNNHFPAKLLDEHHRS